LPITENVRVKCASMTHSKRFISRLEGAGMGSDYSVRIQTQPQLWQHIMSMFRVQACQLVLMYMVIASITAPSLFAQAWATKMFKETSHDFGAVARGAKTEFEFELTNIYEEDLHIASVRSSCGCTSPRITKADLKTWEKGAIVAQFNTRSFIGKKAAVVTVTIDKPYYAEVQLMVSGHIRSDIVVEPGEVQFGDVDQGTAKNTELTVQYVGRSSWKINDVRSQCDYLSVKLKREEQGSGRIGYRLDVGLKDNAPTGNIQQEIILVTDDKTYERISIPVFANVLPPLTIAPKSLDLGDLKPGDAKQQRLVVRGKSPFSITEIVCDDPRFQFKIPTGEKGTHLVPFEFKAADEVGEIQQTITVKTSLGEELKAECQIFGRVQK
jgi:hypothetical protein